MTQQPTLFPQGTPGSPQSPDPQPDQPPNGRRRPPQQAPLWLQYIELSVRVVVRLYLGLIIVALPWTHFWTDNRLLLFVPHLASIALSGAARGVVSGLGLLNIWISVSEAIHFKQS
jgi:hypothetical protein